MLSKEDIDKLIYEAAVAPNQSPEETNLERLARLVELRVRDYSFREAIGLIHMVSNTLYDGENELSKKIMVKLESEINDLRKSV